MNRGRGKKWSEESEHVINHTQDYENAFHKNRKPNQHCYCLLCQPFLPSHESPQSQHGYQPGIWIPCLRTVLWQQNMKQFSSPFADLLHLLLNFFRLDDGIVDADAAVSPSSIFDSTLHSPSYFSNTMPMANLFCNVTHGNHKCEQTRSAHKH